MATDGDGQMTRRTFCNGALLTSAGVVLLAHEVRSQKQRPGETLLAYPATGPATHDALVRLGRGSPFAGQHVALDSAATGTNRPPRRT